MRFGAAAILTLAILAAPARAQVDDKSESQKAAEQRAAQDRAEIERQYNQTIKRTAPVKAGKADPWGAVRPNPAAAGKQ